MKTCTSCNTYPCKTFNKLLMINDIKLENEIEREIPEICKNYIEDKI